MDILPRFDYLAQAGYALKDAKVMFDSYVNPEIMDAQQYVEAINTLRKNENYINRQNIFQQNKYKIEEELEKHYRNIDKL